MYVCGLDGYLIGEERMSTAVKAVKKKKKIRWRKAIPVYLLILPGILYLLINNYMPMFGIVIAFKNINFKKGIFGSDWAGLANFKFLFSSGNAGLIIRNTILISHANYTLSSAKYQFILIFCV